MKKRVALAVSAAATSALALFPATVANAAVPAGYTVSPIVLSSRVFGIAVDPATGLVYVGRYGAITVIDAATQAVEGSIAVANAPISIAVDPATDMIYAASSGRLTVIDGTTNTVVATIAIATPGGQVAVDSATDTAYAGTRLANDVPGVAIIDGATNAVTATIALPGTASYVTTAVDTATDTVYAGTQAGSLSAIDGATNAVSKSVQITPSADITGLAVDSAAGSVYAASDGNTVEVFSAATLAATTSITGCAYHVAAVAADPTANVIYASSNASSSAGPTDSTCVINAATNSVADSFPRGGVAVAADPVTGTAYIAAWYPIDDVWVATPSSTNELSPMDYGFPIDFPSATFAVGVPSSYPLQLSALPAATITEAGALPAGVTMSPTGVFSGTPATGTAGTYPITVTASNGVSPQSTVSLTIVVDIAPAITSPATATFQTAVHGTFTIQATGSPTPTVSAVDYPSWMTFTPESSSGVLSGTPPTGSGGVSTVYISADNGSGTTASQMLTLTVNQPAGLPGPSRLTFRASHHVRYRIYSTGFPAPVLREHGLLPRGLAFQAETNGTALLVGRPARSDKGKRYRITIIASNHIGRTARKTVTIRIR